MSVHLQTILVNGAMTVVAAGIVLLVLKVKLGWRLMVAGLVFLFALEALPRAGGAG